MSQDHIEEMTASVYHKKRGCVVRHVSHFALSNRCSHRGQGYKTSLDKRSKMYNAPFAYRAEDVTTGRTQDIGWKKPYKAKSHPPGQVIQDLWNIGPEGHFKRKSNIPYLHNYHHMIPNGVLNSQLMDDEYGDRLLKLLMAGEYNINHGRNIILLPKEKRVGRIIGLAVHCPGRARSHKQYSSFVKPKLNKIKKELKKQLKDKKIHEVKQKNVKNIAEMVYKISDGGNQNSQGGLVKIIKSLTPGTSINNKTALKAAAK